MIVDDARCIIGSANINDRSLNGNRDSEVALLCIPPPNSRELSRFRCDLMAEHAGGRSADWEFTNDDSVRDVAELLRQFAAANWKAYRDECRLKRGHIVPYPIQVCRETGVVTWEGIPDCKDPRDSTLVGALKLIVN